MKRILIVNYGVGNHQSVVNALVFLGYSVEISSGVEAISQADGIILPGVGAFGEAMKNLNRLGIIPALEKQVLEKKKPLLGICLGMQILADESEENGNHKGLGWIRGKIKKLEFQKGYRVPHVGWNQVKVFHQSPLFKRTDEQASFYFDHSYRFVCEDAHVSATCAYGSDIVAAVQKDNIYGVQFHPEKSQVSGLKLFRSFLKHTDLEE